MRVRSFLSAVAVGVLASGCSVFGAAKDTQDRALSEDDVLVEFTRCERRGSNNDAAETRYTVTNTGDQRRGMSLHLYGRFEDGSETAESLPSDILPLDPGETSAERRGGFSLEGREGAFTCHARATADAFQNLEK